MPNTRGTTHSADHSRPPSEAASIDLGCINDEDAAPVPPAQVAASCEAMEKGSKIALVYDDDAPVPPTHIADALEKRDKVVQRKLEVIDDDGAPLPPTAQVVDQLRGRDAAIRRKCAAVPTPSRTAGPGPPPPVPGAVPGAERRAPLPTPRIRQEGRGAGSLRPEAALPVDGGPGPAPAIELEAQLVQHVQDATLIPGDDELVHGVRVQHVPWYRKRNTFIFGSLGLLVGVGVAVAIALTVGAKDPVVEFIPATEAPSASLAPSPAPSLQPTFQLGALDFVNEVLSNVTTSFANGSVLGLGLKVEFTNATCGNFSVQDIELSHSIQDSTLQQVRVNASGVQFTCSNRWEASGKFVNFLPFEASGTAVITLEDTSSMETGIDFRSYDFEEYPPHGLTFGDDCLTDFHFSIDIRPIIPGIVGTDVKELFRGEFKKNAREYFCGKLPALFVCMMRMTDRSCYA